MKTLKHSMLRFCLGAALLFFQQTTQSQSNMVLLVNAPGLSTGQAYFTTNINDMTVDFYWNQLQILAGGFEVWAIGPNSSRVTVGDYPDAGRAGFSGGAPGIDVNGKGYGCNIVCGGFHIHELETDDCGRPTRLWMTVTQHCECGTTFAIGEIRYHSQMAPPFPMTPSVLRVPEDYPTIQSAIDVASPLVQDTVLVTNGIYYENLDFEGKAVIVTSVNGPSATVIDGDQSGPVASFDKLESSNSVLQGFTLQNGYGWLGSGIAMEYSSPSIIGNIIQNNAQLWFYGAASGVDGGSPVIVGNLIRNNSCDLGGIIDFIGSSSPFIANNVIVNNSGTAINMSLTSPDNPIVINNTIVSNSIGISLGGAIFFL